MFENSRSGFPLVLQGDPSAHTCGIRMPYIITSVNALSARAPVCIENALLVRLSVMKDSGFLDG